MKVLVIVTNYPSPKVGIGLMYIHTRNLFYVKNGIDVTVLNFATDESYEWDGIPVLSLKDYVTKEISFDLLISHAPNLRNHYKFLKKYADRFQNIVFFFHGHEVLLSSKVYSKPYDFVKQNRVKTLMNDLYDSFKLSVWRRYFPQIADKSYFVFVSKWMFDEFKKWVKLDEDDLKHHISITYNSIGENFENLQYDVKCDKKYDFVTIRGFMDGSKYAVDNVCRLAEKYPQFQFLLVGKGQFFEYHTKPENVEWKAEYCNHEQIVELLNQSKCALMPTRTDAQGLMSCEMATFGIPLITSNIPVCHEIFDDFENVRFISNDRPEEGFDTIYQQLLNQGILPKNTKYFGEETVKKELKLFHTIKEKIN